MIIIIHVFHTHYRDTCSLAVRDCLRAGPKIHPAVSTFAVVWTCKHSKVSFILHILQWNEYVGRGCMTDGTSGHLVEQIFVMYSAPVKSLYGQLADKPTRQQPTRRQTNSPTDQLADNELADSQGSYRHYSTFFPGLSRTCEDQIPGFSRTQKTRFQGLSRIHSLLKHGLHEVKKVHIPNQLSV